WLDPLAPDAFAFLASDKDFDLWIADADGVELDFAAVEAAAADLVEDARLDLRDGAAGDVIGPRELVGAHLSRLPPPGSRGNSTAGDAGASHPEAGISGG